MPDVDPRWSAVASYFDAQLQLSDSVLEAALADSKVAGLPPISVTAAEGRFLQILARLRGARRILEIGTLGGYSTIWLARALPPDGFLLTLEISEEHANVARRNIERALLTSQVEVRVAPALETLAQLQEEKTEPFDLVFIDADKESSLPYFQAALTLTRPGALIVVDNVVRDGDVANDASDSPSVQGIRRLFDALRDDTRLDTRLDTTAIQTVGTKGYDGMLLALVTAANVAAPPAP